MALYTMPMLIAVVHSTVAQYKMASKCIVFVSLKMLCLSVLYAIYFGVDLEILILVSVGIEHHGTEKNAITTPLSTTVLTMPSLHH